MLSVNLPQKLFVSLSSMWVWKTQKFTPISKLKKAPVTAIIQIFFQTVIELNFTVIELNFILRFIYDNFVQKYSPFLIFSKIVDSSCDSNGHF